jgi:hypothetical protein
VEARLAAQDLVVRALIGILKAAPSAYVVNQYLGIVRGARHDILNELSQRRPPIEGQPALSLIGIRTHDFDAALDRIDAQRIHLVERGVLLMLGGDPHVLRRANRRRWTADRL